MFVYEKKLQYPVRIQNPNPKLAAIIISQYGGPDGNRLSFYALKKNPVNDLKRHGFLVKLA